MAKYKSFQISEGCHQILIYKHALCSIDAYYKLHAEHAYLDTVYLKKLVHRQYIDFEGRRLDGPGLDDTGTAM